MVFLVLCDFFGQIHSTSLNFSLQIGLWAKKHLVFVFVSILMTMSYMSLEIFSFEWIQILNDTKVWQYHRLLHHKIWATSIHIWFLEFHTNMYIVKIIWELTLIQKECTGFPVNNNLICKFFFLIVFICH